MSATAPMPMMECASHASRIRSLSEAAQLVLSGSSCANPKEAEFIAMDLMECVTILAGLMSQALEEPEARERLAA